MTFVKPGAVEPRLAPAVPDRRDGRRKEATDRRELVTDGL
jgi:hypothetical protein